MDALVLQAVKDECGELEGARIVAVEQYAPMEIGLVLKDEHGQARAVAFRAAGFRPGPPVG